MIILKRAASSLHGSLDELVRMSRTRDAYWRNRVEQEKKLRRLWEENMETLAEEQEHMEEAMNNAIEQRRVTKRALRALSIAAGGPDNGAEYIRRLSVVERNQPSMPPMPNNLPPSYESETLAAAISSEDEDEFFDAIGSESSTIVEQEPPSPPIRPPTATKEKLSKEQELQVSAHGYEGSIRTKFEKLDKDNRPKISLWGILKSMVGKDMTKMVFAQLPSNVDFTGQFQRVYKFTTTRCRGYGVCGTLGHCCYKNGLVGESRICCCICCERVCVYSKSCGETVQPFAGMFFFPQ